MGANAFLEYSKEIINKATTQIEKTWIQLKKTKLSRACYSCVSGKSQFLHMKRFLMSIQA